MRVLAIDHGEARCGCAISDRSGTIARPIEVVEPPDVETFARLASEQDVERIVVGLPLGRDGSEGQQAGVVRGFVAELEAAVEVEVLLYDERLTTAMAGASRRGGARAAEDSLAAAHLLESYLGAAERSRGDG